jgi:hypothetical protein
MTGEAGSTSARTVGARYFVARSPTPPTATRPEPSRPDSRSKCRSLTIRPYSGERAGSVPNSFSTARTSAASRAGAVSGSVRT